MMLSDVFKYSDISREIEFQTNKNENDNLIVQFAASNALDFADACELVYGYFNLIKRNCKGVDLNCGCPQKWAIKECIGCSLLDKPELVADMIKQTKNRVNIPVSIKIRIQADIKKTIEFVKRAEKVGVEFITVHGRTKKQKNSDPVDYEAIKLIVDNLSIPVIANGDIFNIKQANTVAEFTGVKGVMSARGLLENPGFLYV